MRARLSLGAGFSAVFFTGTRRRSANFLARAWRPLFEFLGRGLLVSDEEPLGLRGL